MGQHKRSYRRENALTFWDRNGNPILHVVGEDLNSEDLVKLHSPIKNYLKKKGIIVDNSSEELLEIKDLNM